MPTATSTAAGTSTSKPSLISSIANKVKAVSDSAPAQTTKPASVTASSGQTLPNVGRELAFARRARAGGETVKNLQKQQNAYLQQQQKNAGRDFWDDFWYGAGYGAERIGADLLGAAEGFSDFLGSTAATGLEYVTSLGYTKPNPVSDFFKSAAESYLTESPTNEYKASIEERYNPSNAMRTIGDVEEAVANMLPSLAATYLTGGGSALAQGGSLASGGANALKLLPTGGNLGKTIMGVQAAGNAAQEAKQSGASLGQSLLYGASSGMLESVTESLFGGIPGLGKGAASQFAEKVVGNPISRRMLDIAGEGGEEAISAIVTPYLKRAIYDPDAKNASMDEIVQNALMGMAVAGVLQGGLELPNALQTRSDVVKQADVNLNNPEFVQRATQEAIDRFNQNVNNRTAFVPDNPLVNMLPTVEDAMYYAPGSPAYRGAQSAMARESDVFFTFPTVERTDGGGPYGLPVGSGTKNTASTRETDIELVPITEQAANRLSSGKNNIIARKTSDIISFVRNALRKKGGPERLYMGTIPDSAANTIRDATGVDVSGYTAILPGDSVQHIFKNHGTDATERTRGQRAVTENDISLIPRVLSDPDSVSLSSETDVLGRPVLLLTKRIGDTHITAQAVTDGRHALTTNSLWIQKEKNRPAIPDAGASAGPEGNAQSALPQGPSKSIILPGGQEVNQQVGPESSVGAARKGFDPYSAFQGTKSEFFPEGANAARAVDVPTTDAQGNPIRKTASTAMGAKAIPDNVVLDIQNMVMNGGLSYQVATDKAATTKAISNIKADGFQRSLQQFSDAVQKGVVGVLKTDTPEGQK